MEKVPDVERVILEKKEGDKYPGTGALPAPSSQLVLPCSVFESLGDQAQITISKLFLGFPCRIMTQLDITLVNTAVWLGLFVTTISRDLLLSFLLQMITFFYYAL